MIYNEQEYRTMLSLEQKLWWYRVLHEKLWSTLQSAPRDVNILDIGCGTGGVIHYLLEKGFKKVKGIDLSPFSIKVCQERGLPVESAEALTYLKTLQDGSLDVILFMDSLTYIEEEKHEAVIKECFRVLKPGGRIILNSAAMEAFRGIHDEHVGTLCRLTKKSYRRYAQVAGLGIEKMHYWPFILGFPIYLVRSMQRYKMKRGKAVELKSDLELPAAWLNEFYYGVTKAEQLFSGISFFGSSLFGVLTKPVVKGKI